MALNIITAKFYDKPCAWTDEQWQWDYGQILQFEGLELPEAYEVHFSNISIGGESITQIGGENGVTIPDQFFTTGETIYAWVYLHQGEDDGETVYSVTIPVKKRPQPSDTPPTPQEQSAIDQAIAALNVAVEKSETAITHYPHIQDGTWWVWDVTTETWVDTEVEAQGEPGEDGFSPTITVTDITGGHRVTITDAEGTQTFEVLNGTKGDPGQPGTPGDDGYSPTVTVTEITGGHRVVITDKNGSHTFDVMDGSDATVTVDDELSDESENPVQNKVITGEIGDLKAEINQLSESIAPVESTTTATAAHAVGELFMVGKTLMVALSAIAIGDTIITDGASPNAAVTTLSGEMIKDVQVNGTSIVNQGVANVPIGSASEPGVVRSDSYSGTEITSVGVMRILRASSGEIKSGVQPYRPITPSLQDVSAFYGLAKAAGSDEKNSALAVGTYTDAAKIAIQKMLGIYEAPWELIADVTSSEDSTYFRVATDTNGESFMLKRGVIIAEVPKTTTGARDNLAAQGGGVSPNDLEFYIGFPYGQWVGATSPSVFYYEFDCNGIAPQYTRVTIFKQLGSTAGYTQKNYFLDVNVAKYLKWFQLLQINGNSSLVPSGTRIRIYGQRYIQ